MHRNTPWVKHPLAHPGRHAERKKYPPVPLVEIQESFPEELGDILLRGVCLLCVEVLLDHGGDLLHCLSIVRGDGDLVTVFCAQSHDHQG